MSEADPKITAHEVAGNRLTLLAEGPEHPRLRFGPPANPNDGRGAVRGIYGSGYFSCAVKVLGNFADSMVPLHGYPNRADLPPDSVQLLDDDLERLVDRRPHVLCLSVAGVRQPGRRMLRHLRSNIERIRRRVWGHW